MVRWRLDEGFPNLLLILATRTAIMGLYEIHTCPGIRTGIYRHHQMSLAFAERFVQTATVTFLKSCTTRLVWVPMKAGGIMYTEGALGQV